MDEIALIRRFWEPLGRAVTHPSVREGIGNDGAVIGCEPGYDQVITVDTLLENELDRPPCPRLARAGRQPQRPRGHGGRTGVLHAGADPAAC